MKSLPPRVISARSVVSEAGSGSANLFYSAAKIVIPEDGWYRIDGFAGMSSTSAADSKKLSLARNGIVLPDSSSGQGDPTAVNVTLSYATTWEGRLQRGDLIQLVGQQNGASTVVMGNNSAPNVSSQRLLATRIG